MTPATATRRSTRSTETADPRRIFRKTAEVLKQLADGTRVQILSEIHSRGEVNVTELCKALGTQSQPAVSHHLALLRHGGLIEPHRVAKHNFYRLTEKGQACFAVVQTAMSE